MNRAIKRISKDIMDLTKTPLTDSNIYVNYDEDNMFKLRVLMIGTEETPYDGGFYLFDFTFPNTYPMAPPSVNFCTIDPTSGLRFNPNLYVDGKVCLSIIGTWSGPQWSPMNSITTVLLAIQAMVLVKYPLKNEPGYENSDTKTLIGYNDVIWHENFRVAVLQMLTNLPNDFICFQDTIEKHFIDNIARYRDNISASIKNFLGKTIKSPVYGMTINCKYEQMLNNINELHTNIVNRSIDNEIVDLAKDVVDLTKDVVDLTKDVVDLTKNIKDIKVQDIEDIKVQDDEPIPSVNPINLLDSVSMDSYLTDIKEVAKSFNVSFEKKSKKSGNLIHKTKKDFLKDFKKIKLKHMKTI